MASPADAEVCCQGQEQDGFCVSCRPADAERGVSLQRLRLIIDNYQGTPYPLNRTSLREVFDELERLRRLNTVLRGMLAQGNPCIHEQIESARADLAAGRTTTFEELDAALAQLEQPAEVSNKA